MPELPFPRRVLTEQEAISHHIKYLADHLGSRLVGSDEGARARRYILDTVKCLGFSAELQPFPTKVPIVRCSRLLAEDGRPISCLPVIGSPSTPDALRGVPRVISLHDRSEAPSEAPAATFALSPLRVCAEGEAVAAGRGTTAVLLYSEQTPELYSAVVMGNTASVPCVTIRRADALWLAQERPQLDLILEVDPIEALGVNILVQIGKGGRPLLFLAHYDSRPGTPGAYRNASGVAALLELLTRLQGWRGHRILVGFLDGEELGAAGSRHCRDVLQALELLREIRGVVYVSGLGLRRLSVVSETHRVHAHLTKLAVQCAADEGILASAPPAPSAWPPIPASTWSCPVIALTGPPLTVQYTGLEQPDLLHPRFVSGAVSVLDRLARIS